MTRAALLLALVLWGRGCAGFGEDGQQPTPSTSCVLPEKEVGTFLGNDVCTNFAWPPDHEYSQSNYAGPGVNWANCLDTQQTNVGKEYKIEVWSYCQAHFYGTCWCHESGHVSTGGCHILDVARRWWTRYSNYDLDIEYPDHHDMCEASTGDSYFEFSKWGYDPSLSYSNDVVNSVPPRSERRKCDMKRIKSAFLAGRVTEQHYCWQTRYFQVSQQYVQPYDSRFFHSSGAPPANFKQMQDTHCYEWSNYPDDNLQMCHPSTTLDACSQKNFERSCYIQPSSQFFTVAYFPWAYRKTVNTPGCKGCDSGPALVSSNDTGSVITPLAFKTGLVEQCNVCDETVDCDPAKHYLHPLHTVTWVQLLVNAATEDTWSHWITKARDVLSPTDGSDNTAAAGQPPKTIKFIVDKLEQIRQETLLARNVSIFEIIQKPRYNTYLSGERNRICDKQRTLGCYSWYGSQSLNPCLEGGPGKQQFINTCHKTEAWLEALTMYTRWKAHELQYGARVDENGADVGRDHLALFVPQLEGFDAEFSLTLHLSFDSACMSWYQSVADAAATDDGIHYIPCIGGNGSPVYFKLTPVHRRTGESRELHCTCPVNETHLYGAVGSTPALMHECELCAGNEYRAIRPGTVARQCGATKYTCLTCATQGVHFIRRKHIEGDIGGCVECPPGHIANKRRAPDDYWTRLRSTHLLTLDEMRVLSSMRYGVEWRLANTALLREHQLFVGSFVDTFAHIHGTRLEGGGWTCHICAFGFKFVARQCLPLRLLHMRWSQDGEGAEDGEWSLETLPVGVVISGQQPAVADEVTVNARRDVIDNVPNGKYLDSTALANATFVQHDCPLGMHVNGYFRHMCGQPGKKIWVTVAKAEVLQPGLTLAGYPPLGEQLLFDLASKTFAKASYDRVDGAGLPDPFAGTLPYAAVPGLGGGQFAYLLELERGGVDLACWRCTDRQYNAGCASTGEGSFGQCRACRTTPAANKYLSHALAMGCTGWDDTAVFVDSDYEDAPCTGLEVSGGEDGRRIRLCVGFCGGYSQFKWWRPVVGGDSDIDTGEIPFSQICQKAAIEAGTAGSECQHPDTDDPFGIASNFEECSDTIPYCPVGFHVDAACAESQVVAGRGQLRQFAPACCKRCQQACAVNERRRSDWAQCPGDTVVDTQARCGAGCDVNYYFDMQSKQCKMCESCLEGLRV